MIDFITNPDIVISLLTLTFLEVVLGIDNIVFISICANRLPEKQRTKVTRIGLLLAMFQRILLLFGVSYLTSLKTAFYMLDLKYLTVNISFQTLILFFGGIFLIYKSTNEIYKKMEITKGKETLAISNSKIMSFSKAIFQIILIDFIFSIDSILTAVGMTNGIGNSENQALAVMIIAVVISILVMLLFAKPIREFIDAHPSIQVLGLAFLILIGFMLVIESAHISNLVIFNSEIGNVPKGYLYFSILFSLMVEMINMRVLKKRRK